MKTSAPLSKIRVLVVDDSAVIRQILTELLTEDGDIEIIGTAPDPYIAREKLISLKPDVMTLDIEMPRMDGITFLQKVMEHFPTRTVVISSLSQAGSELALKAFACGAADVIAKPSINLINDLRATGEDLRRSVRAAACARLEVLKRERSTSPAAHSPTAALGKTTHQILTIAASTGGTEALKTVLQNLPADIFGTLIVQHMPPIFTRAFADHLATICPFEVKEAAHGDRVHPGRVLIAPGNFHMILVRSGAQYYVHLNQNAPLHSVRPSADPLFESVARIAGRNAIGVILTGMGRDGAAGLFKMKEAGALTISQDENSCVVYGMPREAVALGAVQKVLPLTEISPFLVREMRKRVE